MFDVFNEVILGSANRVAAAYDASRLRTFHNASQLDTAWRQTFPYGNVCGGISARPPDMLKYYNK
jgi:hypothetical protein